MRCRLHLIFVLVALQVVASCSKQRLYVQPSQLAAHAEEFRKTGKARVEVTPSGTTEVKSDKVLQIWMPGKSKSLLWGLVRIGKDDERRVVSVAQLVDKCGSEEPCLAERVRDRPVWIATRSVFEPAAFAMGTFLGVATVGSITCLAVCEDPPNAAYVGAGIAVVGLLYILAKAH